MGFLLYSLGFLAFTAILWKISSAAKYVLKFLIFAISSLFFACMPIPYMLLKPRDSRNALIPAYLLRVSRKVLGLEYSVEGTENIVRGSGCVVLINHQSAIDLIILAYLWPLMPNSTVISKKEIFYIQPFGLASWLWGTIFINRVNAKDAQSAVNKTGETIRRRKFTRYPAKHANLGHPVLCECCRTVQTSTDYKNTELGRITKWAGNAVNCSDIGDLRSESPRKRKKKARVLMFPEGTRNSKKELLPFKKGAFHLAIASKVPIQPVAVSRYSFLGKTRFDSGNVKIRILPAISTEGYTTENLAELIDKTYKVMSENVNDLSSINETNGVNGKLKSS